MPETEKKAFYEYLGHGKDINENICQAQLAMKEIVQVARHLLRIDKGVLFVCVFKTLVSYDFCIVLRFSNNFTNVFKIYN